MNEVQSVSKKAILEECLCPPRERTIEAILAGLGSSIFASEALARRVYRKVFGSDSYAENDDFVTTPNNIKDQLIYLGETSSALAKLLQELNDNLFEEDN